MRRRLVRAFTWLASIGLISSALALSYIVLFPVNVLTNWTLNIRKDHYTTGETVVLESLYTKNYDVKGTSQRYLECKNQTGVFVRYLLNEATADRAAGKSTRTGVVVTIPQRVAEVKLPTTCFFSITILYDVYPRRANVSYVRSPDFTLSEPDVQTQQPAINPSPDVQTQAVSPQPGNDTSNSLQSVQPAPQSSAQATPQPQAAPAKPVPQPKTGLHVIPLLDGALNLIGL